MQWQCATGPEHADRLPLQRAVWLVNAAAAGPPRWVWVFEAHLLCQGCRKARGKAKSEVSEHQSAGAGGALTDLDACVAPPSKRQKSAASNGASPAEATAVLAVPAAAPQAAVHAVPQAAVYICNAMDSLSKADSARCADLFIRVARRLRPVSGSDAASETKREKLLRKLKRGAGTISGDRYELWLTAVRVQGVKSVLQRRSLTALRVYPLHHRTTTAQQSSGPTRKRTLKVARSKLRRFSKSCSLKTTLTARFCPWWYGPPVSRTSANCGLPATAVSTCLVPWR